jgi:hypothetical protein
MMLQFLKPILITTLISSSIAFLYSSDLLTFTKYFFFVTITQIILYNIYKNLIELFTEKIKNERIKEFTKQGIEISCPCYLNKKMFVPIELGVDNSFNCLECKKDVSVEINTKTFLKTEMIDLDVAETDLIKAYKQIQEKQ